MERRLDENVVGERADAQIEGCSSRLGQQGRWLPPSSTARYPPVSTILIACMTANHLPVCHYRCDSQLLSLGEGLVRLGGRLRPALTACALHAVPAGAKSAGQLFQTRPRCGLQGLAGLRLSRDRIPPLHPSHGGGGSVGSTTSQLHHNRSPFTQRQQLLHGSVSSVSLHCTQPHSLTLTSHSPRMPVTVLAALPCIDNTHVPPATLVAHIRGVRSVCVLSALCGCQWRPSVSRCPSPLLLSFSLLSSSMPFNPEKLAKLVGKTGGPATVRTGGKGTVRRKHKAVRKAATHDDKRLKATLNKLAVRDIPAIEEVNLFRDDGMVVHFVNPK